MFRELPIDNFDPVFLRQIFHPVLLGVGNGQPLLAINDEGPPFGFLNELSRGIAVGFDEATCAELDASEITDDKERDVDEVIAFEMHKDRFAGGARGLAIIGESSLHGKGLRIGIENTVGEGQVIGVREFLLKSFLVMLKLN